MTAPWRFLPCASCCTCESCLQCLGTALPDDVLVTMPALENGDLCENCPDYDNFTFELPYVTGCLYRAYFDDDICCGGSSPTPDYKEFRAILSDNQCVLRLWYVICDPRNSNYWERHVWQASFDCPIGTLDHDLTYDPDQFVRFIPDDSTVCVADNTIVHVSGLFDNGAPGLVELRRAHQPDCRGRKVSSFAFRNRIAQCDTCEHRVELDCREAELPLKAILPYKKCECPTGRFRMEE